MSVEELQTGIETAWKHAYSWRSIVRRIRRSPAPWPVRLGTNLGYRFYAHHLSQFYNCDWIIGRQGGATFPSPSAPQGAAQGARLRDRMRALFWRRVGNPSGVQGDRNVAPPWGQP